MSQIHKLQMRQFASLWNSIFVCNSVFLYIQYSKKLQGESALHAILLSHMEMSYCTTRFFPPCLCKLVLAAFDAFFVYTYVTHDSLSKRAVNAWQWKSALFVPKQSEGTITHSPWMTVKMAATAIALHGGQNLIPPFNIFGNSMCNSWVLPFVLCLACIRSVASLVCATNRPSTNIPEYKETSTNDYEWEYEQGSKDFGFKWTWYSYHGKEAKLISLKVTNIFLFSDIHTSSQGLK